MERDQYTGGKISTDRMLVERNADIAEKIKLLVIYLSRGVITELYVQLYKWFPMLPTMHKIVIHGPIVVQKALLPIDQLSKEAAE